MDFLKEKDVLYLFVRGISTLPLNAGWRQSTSLSRISGL